MSLRQLPNYFFENDQERDNLYLDNTNPSEFKNVGMLLLYQHDIDIGKLKEFIDRLPELFVKPDYIAGV